MKVKYIAMLAAVSLLSIGVVSCGGGGVSNPCAGANKENPCAGVNPCAGAENPCAGAKE